MRWGALALAVATLAGCASTENALRDANVLMEEREADKLLPVTNLSPYAQALSRFGRMLDQHFLEESDQAHERVARGSLA